MNGGSRQSKVLLHTMMTPRTVATDHLIRRLGLNFRAGDPVRASDGFWHVPLRALIPASPDVVPRREDQLYYRFEPFGEILLDPNLNVIQVPRKSELRVKFREEVSNLFAKIEAMILEYGSDKWGRIPLIRSFLNPLNAIVSQALSLPNISVARLQQQEYALYSDWMKKAGFLEESTERTGYLRKTNQLVAIADKYRKEKGFSFYVDETAIDVTSIICWKFYPEIIERIKVIPSYVDTTVAYYVKTVKTKKLVPMSVSELEYSYNVLGRREQDTKVTFYGKVADLVTAGFLRWASEGVVIGVDEIYNRVEGLGPELGDNVHLLKAIA